MLDAEVVMSDSKLPRPTDVELGILRVLWARGPSTVREVHEALQDGSGYTTVLKMMQIMTEKGLVVRDESQRAHVYSARATQEKTQRQLVTDLVDRAFGGSTAQLAMQALSTKKTSPEELAELRRLLDSLEQEAER
jgi:predicted transcriptional regulator